MEKIVINQETDVLLVIDMQKDFAEGGKLAVNGGLSLVEIINGLLANFRDAVASQDNHPAGHSSFASTHDAPPFSEIAVPYGTKTQTLWPDHCVQGTEGAEFLDGLRAERFKAIIRKGMNPKVDSYSAFFENDRITATGLTGLLRELGKTRLFVGGIAKFHCDAYTCLDGVAQGFEVYLVGDATAAIPDMFAGPEEQEAVMTARLLRAGVKIITTEDIA